MSVVDDSYGHPLKTEEKATAPLAGGIANMGYQCGMLWGASLAAGAQTYRLLGSGPEAETAAVTTTQKLMKPFRARTKNEINCLEITELDMQNSRGALKFVLKGGPIGCFRMAAGYAKEVRSGIDAALAEEQPEAPPLHVSCAAIVAQKMGASGMHTVMAAGFAGGIGLSGGACGALGAAIWLSAMNQPVEMDGFSYSGTWVDDLIQTYLESADYEFECAAVVGRKFEDVGDHADYICNGGCAEIIETLAATQKSKA